MQRQILLQHTARALLLGFICLLPIPAWAYLLPPRFYLRKATKKRSGIRRLRVEQHTVVFEAGKAPIRYRETLWLVAPGKGRLERRIGKKLVTVKLWTDQSLLTWQAGRGKSSATRTPFPAIDLFAFNGYGSGYGSLTGLLRKYKVRTRGRSRTREPGGYRRPLFVRLAWFVGGPALVFGRQRGNQVWLDKKSLFPVRFRGQLVRKGPRVDILFRQHFQSSRGATYPGLIEMKSQGKLRQRTMVSRVQVNPRIPKRLMIQVR